MCKYISYSLLLSVSIFPKLSLAEKFTSLDKKATIEVYGNMYYTCRKDGDSIEYKVYNNQTDEKYLSTCAVTNVHHKCNGKVIDGDCRNAKLKVIKWKTISTEKLVYLSTNYRSDCFDEVKKLTEKLKVKEYYCTESGIN